MSALSAPDTEPADAIPIANPDHGVYKRAHAVAAIAAVPGINLMNVSFIWNDCLMTFIIEEDILPAFLKVNPNVVRILATFEYADEEVGCYGLPIPTFPEGSAVKMTFFKLIDAVIMQLNTVWKTHAGRENTDQENRWIHAKVVDLIVKRFWTDSREYVGDNA